MDGTNEGGGNNVGTVERAVSIAGGVGLAAYGLMRRSPAGYALAATGAALLYRGVTGHCPGYGALGVSTADGDAAPVSRRGIDERGILHNPDATVEHGKGIKAYKSVIVDKPAEEMFRFWRNFENLPRFMKHLESVAVRDERTSHWVVKAPAGRTVAWDAEIINEIENELIAWRTVGDADVEHAGSVRFEAMPGGRGTKVTVNIEYRPPAGKAGFALAKLFGEEPNQQVDDDLRRFKQVMEAGEIATTDGQPSGRAA